MLPSFHFCCSEQIRVLELTLDRWKADTLSCITELRGAIRSGVSGLYTRATRLGVSASEIRSLADDFASASRRWGANNAACAAVSATSELRRWVNLQFTAITDKADGAITAVEIAKENFQIVARVSSKRLADARKMAVAELRTLKFEAIRSKDIVLSLNKQITIQNSVVEELSSKLERQQVELGRRMSTTPASQSVNRKILNEMEQISLENSEKVRADAVRTAHEDIAAARALVAQAEREKGRMLLAKEVAEEESNRLREKIRQFGEEADRSFRAMQVQCLNNFIMEDAESKEKFGKLSL